jgi:ABC-type polar amino acid transport system ATPase subunit
MPHCSLTLFSVIVLNAHSLDPEQRDTLIEIIQQLLKDNSTMVIGSAMFAFNEVPAFLSF